MHNKCQFLAPGKFSRRNKAEREKEEACLIFSVQREYLNEGGWKEKGGGRQNPFVLNSHHGLSQQQ